MTAVDLSGSLAEVNPPGDPTRVSPAPACNAPLGAVDGRAATCVLRANSFTIVTLSQ